MLHSAMLRFLSINLASHQILTTHTHYEESNCTIHSAAEHGSAWVIVQELFLKMRFACEKNFLTSVCREREEELSRGGGMRVRAKHSSSFIPALAWGSCCLYRLFPDEAARSNLHLQVMDRGRSYEFKDCCCFKLSNVWLLATLVIEAVNLSQQQFSLCCNNCEKAYLKHFFFWGGGGTWLTQDKYSLTLI